MTPLKPLIAAAAVAFGLMTVAETAAAGGRHGHHRHGHHHGHHHHHWARFSFGFWGGPYWGPYWGPGWGYWGPPAVYAPSVVVQQEPRVWVESEQASTPTPPVAANTNPNAPQWWYWCASSRGYYPYVSSCAEGWQRVTPQPVPAQ